MATAFFIAVIPACAGMTILLDAAVVCDQPNIPG
jgi:hypothetical protein